MVCTTLQEPHREHHGDNPPMNGDGGGLVLMDDMVNVIFNSADGLLVHFLISTVDGLDIMR